MASHIFSYKNIKNASILKSAHIFRKFYNFKFKFFWEYFSKIFPKKNIPKEK